jgi:hypothetical protein
MDGSFHAEINWMVRYALQRWLTNMATNSGQGVPQLRRLSDDADLVHESPASLRVQLPATREFLRKKYVGIKLLDITPSSAGKYFVHRVVSDIVWHAGDGEGDDFEHSQFVAVCRIMAGATQSSTDTVAVDRNIHLYRGIYTIKRGRQTWFESLRRSPHNFDVDFASDANIPPFE